MPEAKSYRCRIVESIWLTPTVVRMRFTPSKKFPYEPGQFLSVVIPAGEGDNTKPVKRCYSFATPFEQAKKNGYELCVKVVPGGLGSTYLSSLRPGDYITVFGPYGDFQFKTPAPGRSVCFISTGSGLAPFRSIMLSEHFHENPPRHTLSIFGARTEDELLYRGAFEPLGIEAVYAVSNPDPSWPGFRGRVTDYLRTLPKNWQWHSTDFYLCGNGEMVAEVADILRGGHGVLDKAIHKENFSLVAPPRLDRKQLVAQVLDAPRIEKPAARVAVGFPSIADESA